MKYFLEDKNFYDGLFSRNCLLRFEKDALFEKTIRPNVTLWFQIHEAFDFILVCSRTVFENWPQVQLYSFEHDYLSSVNGKLVNIDGVSQRLTAVLSEPYDSATLSLNDGRFLWIKYGFPETDESSIYTLQIDVTSIDRSKLLRGEI